MRIKVIAEIGINHSGSVATAVDLMRVAKLAGCDAVKFQKRDLELAIPPSMRLQSRATPWGPMLYPDYKQRLEFGEVEFAQLSCAASGIGIEWSASAFDPPSVAFLHSRRVPWLKIPSAVITDHETLAEAADTRLPLYVSTGGASWHEIDEAVRVLDATPSRVTLMHCCSVYPHRPEAARLGVLSELRQRYGLPVGYSGHEAPDYQAVTLGAVALGATVVERHITLSRRAWGSDQAASVEPEELMRLVREIRALESALTYGAERPVDVEERAKIETMRRTSWA